MIIVAVLVLPAAALLLLGTDRIEEWLSRPPTRRARPPTDATGTRRTHLHLVPGASRSPDGTRSTDRSGEHRPAA